ncbi:MAG: cation diffusion facilitator family transporter [Promethearchaeota archaeon]
MEKKSEKIVSRLSIILVLIVFACKISVSFFTQSFAFYTELSDSILDFLTVFITYVALKEGQKPADNEHMFGHYKINSVAGFIQSLLLIAMYGTIFYVALKTLIIVPNYRPTNTLPAAISLSVILVIVFFVSRKIVKIGKSTKNQAIIAQGANFRSDFYRNIAVIVGLIITTFGIYIIDLILAMFFSLLSIYQGWGILHESFDELIDANRLSEDEIKNMRDKTRKIPGVDKINTFAIKTAGNILDANIYLELEKEVSMVQTNLISDRVRNIIKNSCTNYKCNILVQLSKKNLQTPINIFQLIRLTFKQKKKQYRLHNLQIDQFQDKILIQFHAMVDSNLSLQEAHNIITKFESEMKENLLQNQLIRDSGLQIEIISHIEPSYRKDIIHSYNLPRTNREDLKIFVLQCFKQFSMEIELKTLQILEDKEYFSITFTIQIPGNVLVENAHHIAEKLEFDMHSHFENLSHCLIHVEPINNA